MKHGRCDGRWRGWAFICVLLVPSLLTAGQSAQVASAPRDDDRRSNILLIVADDMGYSDLGVYGSEIATANLDALARDGVLFTQFHTAPNCAPSRGALLTGVDSHRAGLGGNAGAAADNQRDHPAYQGFLRDDVVTVAEVLADAGYNTYMAGKWHLGHDERNMPSGRGFQRSFALLNGGASHFADQEPIIPGSKTQYVENGRPVDELPADFYSTTAYTDRMIEFISADAGDDDGAPFFGYLAFTAPHNPLHVPAAYREKYRGAYDQGWDALAAARTERLRESKMIGAHHTPHARPDWVLAWDELTPEQRASRARDMEIYAGMIDCLDENVGRLVAYLREIDEYDNTLIVFISDNGASKTTIMDYVAFGGEAAKFFERFDNSLANRGAPGSSSDIGPGWAYACSTPHRLFKGYVAQGGIQVPAIAKPVGAGERGRRERAPVHGMDLMPTFLEIAGATWPDTWRGIDVAAAQGVSIVSLLQGRASSALADRGLGWEAYGMDAYRRGDWKILRLPEPFGNGTWQLYDLALDPGETRDRAGELPGRVRDLAASWDAYAETNGVIHPSKPSFYSRPVKPGKY